MTRIYYALFAAFLFAAFEPSAAMAEVATRTGWIPGSTNVGDVWTFSCPAGGNFDLTIQNGNDGTGGSIIDLALIIVNPVGAIIASADDTIACTNPGCNLCPRVLNQACSVSGTYSIKVYSVVTCNGEIGAGGSYQLSLEVSDSTDTPVTAKKAKLGGGPKSKVPAWHTAHSAPAIDDGNLN